MAYWRMHRKLSNQPVADSTVMHAHYLRFKALVEGRKPRLVCQACGGSGFFHEVEYDDGTGPDYDCGWCEGTGLLTGRLRGEWLRMQKALKKDYLDSIPHATLGGYYN